MTNLKRSTIISLRMAQRFISLPDGSIIPSASITAVIVGRSQPVGGDDPDVKLTVEIFLNFVIRTTNSRTVIFLSVADRDKFLSQVKNAFMP